jgi:deazaflavin-dependent oxidoreductase (nitroreductase family)
MSEVSRRQQQDASSGSRPARLPPRWFIVTFWHAHRAFVNATRGRLGLWRPKPGRWGVLRLSTIGRRTARPRAVLVGYFEDGDNLITLAMNGWGEAEPAWWLNLQAHPDTTVRTRDGIRPVHARRAEGAERERLWSRWASIDRDLDAYAARRPGRNRGRRTRAAPGTRPAVVHTCINRFPPTAGSEGTPLEPQT